MKHTADFGKKKHLKGKDLKLHSADNFNSSVTNSIHQTEADGIEAGSTDMIQLVFPDKCVTYETFINDLATAIVPKVMAYMENPSDIISQNMAFKLFGQGNIRRWRQKGLVEPVSKRPGKIEYRISDLRILQQRKQDYFE